MRPRALRAHTPTETQEQCVSVPNAFEQESHCGIDMHEQRAEPMTGHEHTVACLAGGGAGPELMAEPSRALAEVSRLHSFRIHEVHVPFGSEAVSAWGHPLPPTT